MTLNSKTAISLIGDHFSADWKLNKVGHIVQITTNGFKDISVGQTPLYQLPKEYWPQVAPSWEVRDPYGSIYRLLINSSGLLSVYTYSLSGSTIDNISTTLVYLT